jgi:polyisoprenoid-binding protein YceI
METTHEHPAMQAWTLDPIHSWVGFSVRHLMISNAHGELQRPSGTVRFDPTRPERLELDVSIDAASINTRAPQRDAHLRSPDFFDVERHPIITFRSTGGRVVAGGALEIVGDLTLRGTTRPVTLQVVELTGEQRDHNGVVRRGASATAKIKRSDYGMTYNKVLEAGGLALGDEITLSLEISLLQQSTS